MRIECFCGSYGDFEIEAVVQLIGKDCVITIYGGDEPHVGACFIGSTEHSAHSVLCLPGHKEGAVVYELGKKLLKARDVREGFPPLNFVLCCGIHIDNITRKQINDVLSACQSIFSDIILWLYKELQSGANERAKDAAQETTKDVLEPV